MSTYLVRPAALADLTALIELRTEAEQWLRAQKIHQWTEDYHDYARDVLRQAVETGTAWIVEDNGLVVATISINGPDPDFWDPQDDPESALYLGKMIVARSHAGRDLGAAIMNWASVRAAREGKRWMRIDVRRDNEQLHRYYLDRGWSYVRTVDPPRRRTESGTLFQRPAGSITPASSRVVEAPERAS
jgi:GNAT superfamily N-acetyltransferase